MMEIIPWLIAKGVPARFVKPLLGLIALIAVAGLLWAAIAYHDRNVIKAHDATVNAKVIAKTAPANDHAADQRATDAITIDRHGKETHDAIHSVPDAQPAGPSVRLACDRLRRQGTDIAKLSACR